MRRIGTTAVPARSAGGEPPEPPAAGPVGVGRRRIVAGAGAGALALAVARFGGGGAPATVSAQQSPFADDAEALQLALSVELLSVALLTAGLAAFDAAAFAASALPDRTRPDLELMRKQDRAHAARLSTAITELGGTPAEAVADPPLGDDPVAFVERAAALKETAVAAYAAVARAVVDAGQRETALGILSVEARHAAHLQDLLGAPAFPTAIDPPLAPPEIETALAALAAAPAAAPAAAASERQRGSEADPPAAAPPPDAAPARREPRRVQDAPGAAEPDLDRNPDPDSDPDTNDTIDSGEEPSRPAGPPPVQEIPIQGTTGSLDPPRSTAPTAPDVEPQLEPEPESEPQPELRSELEPEPPAQERRRGSDRERRAAPEAEGGDPGAAEQERFTAVIADAAAQLGVDPAAVQIVESEKTEWPDASLGCPQPGEFYAQVVTPGFLVVVAAAGAELEYHTDRRGRTFVLCQE